MNPFVTCLLGSLSLAAVAKTQVPYWTNVRPPSSPADRQNHAMVYDSARKKCVLFGGWDCTARRGDTWEWDGVSWSQPNTASTPSRRDATALAYDSTRQVTVMTAGYGSTNGEWWEYDGISWAQKFPATTHNLGPHAIMTYDSARQVCVLIGGNPPETWEWDGTTCNKITTATVPVSGSRHCIAYDSLRRVAVAVMNNQTWEYDGTDWVNVVTRTAPVPSTDGPGLVYDSARQVIVRFGGSTNSTSTWEYDGADWREIMTGNSPGVPRQYVAMAYDSDRERTVLFGGRDVANAVCLGDTWEYAGRPCGLTTNTHAIARVAGGQQRLSIDGGTSRAAHLFWIFGSITGTNPGFQLNRIDFPLNPDFYTDLAISAVGPPTFVNFRGVLDINGKATADFVVPPGVVPSAFNLHHAGLIYFTKWDCSTNSVLVQIK